MKLSQIFRKFIFRSLDILKGNPIKKNYEDIQNLIENSDKESLKNKKDLYLKGLLQHAVDTTAYYKKNSEFSSIADFPLTNKNLIRDHFDEFVSSKYTPEKCTLVSTSGSTGAPFSVLQDANKRVRNTADNLYFSKRSGYRIGQQLVYVKIWPDTYKHTIFSKFWLQNVYPQSVFNLKDNDIAHLIDHLSKDSSQKSFLGYTSAFEKICKYLDKIKSGPIQCNVVSIITMSERLNEYTYSAMLKYFGVAPVSRYSNNENGILAQQDRTDSSRFIVNEASYYMEIFDMKEDVVIENGKRGRIVITDLHNYAMPLIRYDTGDIGIIEKDKNDIPFLTSIEGRKLDLIYDTKGNIIPSHVSYKLSKYGDFKQFQLVQYGEKDYLIKLNTDKKIDEHTLMKEYKNIFGNDATISLEYVDEIPLLSSGKRREVSNTYHSQL
ncbi:phenylacetate--CoA ligase family protein [Aquimarina addita]|uniref:Phenylacetate--CoA ligase family protein n=1 Tax=Aquimarina addita TaxID=870485 RepID=A0ABP6UQW9_9FLAO